MLIDVSVCGEMLAGVGKFFTNFKNYYNEINSATLTGAIDVLVVEQPDGTYQSSPFHVRFGKLGVIRSREKVVYIEINGEPVEDLRMKLGPSGEAFFVQPIEEDKWEGPEYLATSPIPESMLTAENVNLPKSVTAKLTSRKISKTRNHQESESNSSSSSELAEMHPLRLSSVFQPINAADEELIEAGGMFDLEVSDDEHRLAAPELAGGLPKTASLPLIEENSRMRTESWAFDPYHTSSQFHPFSDTDITPTISPVGSRPNTPKSDTEFEIAGRKNTLAEESNAIEQWKWGELPERSQESERTGKPAEESKEISEREAKEESGYLQSFMRSSKKVRHQPQKGGLYLDDLTPDLDPDVAALYFPKRKMNEDPTPQDSTDRCELAFKVIAPALVDDDNESGKGASLTSPAESPPPTLPTYEQAPSPTSEAETMKEHDCRIYGDLAMSMCGGFLGGRQDVSAEIFEQYMVTFEAFIESPTLLQDKNLVLRIGGKYYNWQCAAPMLMSMFCFHQTLPQSAQESLTKQYMPNPTTASTQKSSSWWPFGRSRKPDDVEGTSNNSTSSGSPKKPDTKPETKPEPKTETKATVIEIPISEENQETVRQRTVSGTSEQSDTSHYKKTLRLTSEQLEKMNLYAGMNEIEFSVTTAYQGTTRCMAHIFLWKHTDKIIISDIDGTITRSDVLGHILPMVGKDWSQSGVADLYTKIAANGYRFAYLSARAIGQAQITRDYLQNVRQGDVTLPPGPLFLSPSSLINAFHKEVIEKKPEQFKISCMKDIQTLFSTPTALYAGFGNKINDIVAYRAVDIPKSRMFLINPSGLLKSDYSETFQSSYKSLSDVVDHYFPPVEEQSGSLHHGATTYSNFTFWREPMVTVNLDEIAE